MINIFSRYRDGSLGVMDSPTPTLSLGKVNDSTNSNDGFNSFGMNQNPSFPPINNNLMTSDLHLSEHASPSSSTYSTVIKEECKSPTNMGTST